MVRNINIRLIRAFSQSSQKVPPSASGGGLNSNVPGLSQKVLKKADGKVGPNVDPGKSGDYKVPEYFCYDAMSYAHAEVEMAKHRLPQPSALR